MNTDKFFEKVVMTLESRKLKSKRRGKMGLFRHKKSFDAFPKLGVLTEITQAKTKD